MLKKISFAAIGVLVLACYGVPYLLLSRVNAWYGSFLFWTLAGVLVIVLNVVATRDLDQDDEA